MAEEVRVLLVDDSPTVRYHLARMINEMEGIRVIGEATNGEEVVPLVEELRPDVVSMDIRMPGVDGLEATRRVMEECPTPVVVVSSLLETDIELSFRALQAGALAVLAKPPDRSDPSFIEKQRQLVKTLIAMSDVKVIHRRGQTGRLNGVDMLAIETHSPYTVPEIIAIGASAGGPSALSKLLRDLPGNLPVPIAVVQHMSHEFVAGLARWLDNVTPLQVVVAEEGQILMPGVVHLSPGIAHLSISRQQGKLVVKLVPEQGSHAYQPSVNVLFQSVAEVCGAAAIGIVLTGMGNDGAEGLLTLRQAGGRTFAQDRASSTVFGMPGAAVAVEAVEAVLPLSMLATALLKLT